MSTNRKPKRLSDVGKLAANGRSPISIRRKIGEHSAYPRFPQNAKERGTHCAGNARKIKSLGHPAECL